MCGLALRAGGRLRGGRGVGAGGHLLLCGPGTVTSWEPEGREAGPGLGGRVWRAWGPAAWRRVATLSFPHERWESGIPDVAPTSCARELSVGGGAVGGRELWGQNKAEECSPPGRQTQCFRSAFECRVVGSALKPSEKRGSPVRLRVGRGLQQAAHCLPRFFPTGSQAGGFQLLA